MLIEQGAKLLCYVAVSGLISRCFFGIKKRKRSKVERSKAVTFHLKGMVASGEKNCHADVL